MKSARQWNLEFAGWMDTYLVEDEVVGAVVAGELGDADEGDLGGVVEVVDDDDAEALLQQLQHRVAADVPGTARHQDGPEHGGHHRRPLPYFLLPTFLPSSDGIGMPRLAC